MPKILIVDDEPRMSRSVKEVLSGKCYEIEIADSGSEACKKIKNDTFDLVLLDLVMPGIDGFRVMDYIKEYSPQTLIIVLTGFASVDSAIACLRQGAYDYLKKPFETEELEKRVKNALEQKRLEREKEIVNKKLESSESHFHYLIENSPDIIYTLNEEGKFTFISESVNNILGTKSEEPLGKSYTSIIHPDDLDKACRIFNERRTVCRQPGSVTLRLKRHDSSTQKKYGQVIIELKAKGLYDRPVQKKNKVFLGTYGVARDITTRKQAEEELKLQKVYFKQLFENSPEGIVILDYLDRIIDINKSFDRLFLYSINEIKDRYINDLIVPIDLMEEAKSLSETTQSMGVVQKESVRKRKDGKLVDVSILGYPIKHNDCQIGVYGIYSDISERKQSEEKLQQTLKKLRKAMGAIIQAMSSTVEARDPYTAGHQQRVSNLSRAIAQEMRLSNEDIDGIRMAGAIHDLGKINVPAEILSKPGRLTDIEFSLIKIHPKVAYEILKEIEFPWPVADCVFQHHERLDGSGYPNGLSAKNIMQGGKILMVADVVEAIASHRPYRPALGIDKALNEISEKKGLIYDTKAVDACLKLFSENRFSF